MHFANSATKLRVECNKETLETTSKHVCLACKNDAVSGPRKPRHSPYGHYCDPCYKASDEDPF
jgi:hypothetical protein